jgi:PhzF family phenazine biosynthesis protein
MRQWTIDAFTKRPSGGNTACVIEPMDAWPSDGWMQQRAAENAAAGATAFLRRTEAADRFGLRWFTPATEVPLCGHATLAAAHALLREMQLSPRAFTFDTASGPLTAHAKAGAYELSLPLPPFRRIPTPAGLADALGADPSEVWEAPYLVALFDDAEIIPTLRPQSSEVMRISAALGGQGNVGVAAVSAASSGFDVIDRFFAPGYGLPEDPATGSFHAILAPLLAPRLGPGPIRFYQAFPGRGAELTGRVAMDRVIIGGSAVTVAESRRPAASPAGLA